MKALRIGTRGSPLALSQANAVAATVTNNNGPACELIVIKTTGDRLAHASLSDVGGKRLFVKEIEEALLTKTIDVAVHSAKDLPADLPPGLIIGAALPRADPHDALVLPDDHEAASLNDPESIMASLGSSPRLGTGSVRRVALLSARFPTARFEPIRGNIGTRLRKLDTGGYDLLVLAAAGLVRLNLARRISAVLPFDTCLPAPGQGIVAIESRASDKSTAAILATVTDSQTMTALEAERALLQTLGGGCQMPVGGLATPETEGLRLCAVVAALDGSRVLRKTGHGVASAADALGRRVAHDLIAHGAGEILATVGE